MFKQLLVPLDRSPFAEQALAPAESIARAAGAAIDVVLVHEPSAASEHDLQARIAHATADDRYLDTIVSELAAAAAVPTTHALLRGDPVPMIVARAGDVDADLVVMTSHGRTGLSRAWLGSIADGVVRSATTPVLVLRPVRGAPARQRTHRGFKHVLVPFDGSSLALGILGPALSLAACSGAKLTLLQVVQPVPMALAEAGVPFTYSAMVADDTATARVVDEAKQHLSNIAAWASAGRGTSVVARVVVASGVAGGILEFARGHEVDVIAMSTHGRGASRLIVGSIADKLLRASELPVLMWRPIAGGEPAASVRAESTGVSGVFAMA